MKHVLLIFGLLLTLSINVKGQSSNETTVSLLTCGPGTELYTIFGHTALRIQNPVLGQDLVFNYGVFFVDNQVEFLVNFVSGNTNYVVAGYSYADFYSEYSSNGRWVKEQVLDLSSSETLAIQRFLFNNARPENRSYLYNFFYDNCSTRVKDVIEKHLPQYSYADSPIEFKTYRGLVHEYTKGKDWTAFGIDLIIGSPGDEVIDHHGQMFLPDYLMMYADRLKDAKGNKLVSETTTLLDLDTLTSKSWWITPGVLFLVFLIIELLLFYKRKTWDSKWIRIYDRTWFVVASLAAALLMFMMTTLHTACHYNYNMLWLSPLLIPFTFSLFKKNAKWLNYIGIALLVLFILTIGASAIIPQVFPSAGYLLIGILFLKVLRNIDFAIGWAMPKLR